MGEFFGTARTLRTQSGFAATKMITKASAVTISADSKIEGE
jgi:hypothetical protein